MSPIYKHGTLKRGLTMACSILLSMATTLAPEELQERRKTPSVWRLWRRCGVNSTVRTTRWLAANKANGGRGVKWWTINELILRENAQKARRKPADVTYCRPAPMRSPSRAQRTETKSRNSSADKRQDPSPPCNTGNSCYPVHLPPPQATLRRRKLEIQRYKSRKIAHY